MAKGEHGLGAAFDGDGDRNMILGKVGIRAYHQFLQIQISPSLTKVDLNIVFLSRTHFS